MSVADYYSKLAKTYQATNDSLVGQLPEQFASIISKIPAHQTLLDAGCGPGIEAKIACDKGIDVIGLDISAAMLDLLRENAPMAKPLLGSLTQIPLQDRSVDHILCSFALLHLDLDSGVKALREFKRVSRPNSKLFLGLPVGNGTTEQRVHTIAKPLNLEPIPFHWWDSTVLKEKLSDLGYEIVLWSEIKFYPHVPPLAFIEAKLPEDFSSKNKTRFVNSTSWRSESIEVSIAHARNSKEFAGVSRVNRIDTLSNMPVPVLATTRPNSKMALTVTAGKGLTLEESEASAIFEAIEFAAAETLPISKYIREIAEQNPKIIDLDRLATGGDQNDFLWTPVKNFEDSQIHWAPLSSVTMLPTRGPFIGNSHGLASGLCFEEAVLHGFLEILERHAWTFELIHRTALSLNRDSIPESIRKIIQKIESDDWVVEIKDISTNLKIPTYYTIIFNPMSPDTHLMAAGIGCHLDPVIALNRSILEAAQSLSVSISGAREDLANTPRFVGSEASDRMKIFKYWYQPTSLKVNLASEPFESKSLSWRKIILDLLRYARSADSNLGNLYYYVYPSPQGTWVVRTILEGAELFCIDPKRVSRRLAEEFQNKIRSPKIK